MAKKRALISVFDKKGIVEFVQELVNQDYEILSTGGTAALLKKNNILVMDISEYTGQPEMMDGRVKTLHPKIFGGILAMRDNKEHMQQLKQFDMSEISLVCVNLYPFLEKVMADKPLPEIIENIDIGGPSLIRAAAKNYKDVLVVTDPSDYDKVIGSIKDNAVSDDLRNCLVTKAFSHTARYDTIISRFFSEQFQKGSFPDVYNFTFEKIQDLRYGENPHQKAALYKPYLAKETGVATAKQLHGKELSYNNILDSDEALGIIKDFSVPTAAIIKHTNPSGVASAASIEEAYEKALAADPKSAFGCIVAINKPCSLKLAEMMKPNFIEVIIAPSFDKKAIEMLTKKKNLRLLETGPIIVDYSVPNMRRVASGLLVQTRQFPTLKEKNLEVVTKRAPTKKEMKDLLFAWKVNKHVKSNSIVFAKDEVTVGIGAGQMSRIDAVNLVKIKEESNTKDSVMSSDAFFPFRDGLDQAVEAGATAIIQPGGSIRDEEIIKAADEHGIAMVFTGVRLFKH